MPTISVTDKLGLKLDLQFDSDGDAAQFGLQSLESKTQEFVQAANQPLSQSNFRSATFGGVFNSPSLALNDTSSLGIKSGAAVTISLFRSSDGELFETGGASPAIKIASNEVWLRIAFDTTLALKAGVAMPSGFGVAGSSLHLGSFATYTLFEPSDASPTLKQAVEKAFANLKFIRNSKDLESQPLNTVYEWDVAGTLNIESSYAYPFSVNAFSIAKAALPFHQDLQISPALTLQVTGSLAVTGEFRGRSYRGTGAPIQIGLYKKKETDLSAEFQAGAGVSASAGSTDLLSAFFSVWPGANFDKAQPSPDERKLMQDALSGALDQGFSVALNGSCAAALTDETAVLYQVDLESDTQTTQALDAALSGNWTMLAKLRSARELRNVLTQTRESQDAIGLNLLGIYDYASTEDFVRQCCILHNLEDGAITITDRETAQHIAVSAKPFLAQDERLRKALDEAFLATVAYSAADARAGFDIRIDASQSLLLYSARMDYAALRKALLLGVAFGLIAVADLSQISVQRNFKYVRLSATTEFQTDNALRLFFSDIKARTPYKEADLKTLGRKVLASLLDRNSAVDKARRQVLADDAIWAQMDAQKFPEDSPASYSDWYDITFWAHSVATVAPRLKLVLDAADAKPTGDPTKNAQFMSERQELAKAIAEVTRNTRAAFEKGWPLAVMFTLAGRKVPTTFSAQWDGKVRFEKKVSLTMTA
jgi:hypothetical protein